jgi:hypothetical protein
MNRHLSRMFSRKYIEQLAFNVLFFRVSISNRIARVSSCLGLGISSRQIMDYSYGIKYVCLLKAII